MVIILRNNFGIQFVFVELGIRNIKGISENYNVCTNTFMPPFLGIPKLITVCYCQMYELYAWP